ncbi:MAG: type II toxin-antitoxin system Phd/YefM family antitoxin [Caldilineaceae bacterium]|nr:type II toxin-antitoxin system Phd/YefM family antitoxin [Caldilineaceae bacterium]
MKEVVESNDQVVITTRNEPQVVIMSYPAYQRQQRLRAQGTQHLMGQLVQEATVLLQTTRESCGKAGEADLYLFLVHFEQLMHDLWETAEAMSPAHATLASELLDIVRIYLGGEAQLQPAHLEPLTAVIALFNQESLTMAEVAEADRMLLAHGLDAFFPVHGDLSPLYENQTVAPA